jgi:F0F1-type ATP synthase membrane subunit b/b'
LLDEDCEGAVVPSVVVSLQSLALLAGDAAGKSGSFLDTLPDPMKPTFFEIGFIAVLLVLLHFFLKASLFGPLGKLMDDREAEILAGASVKLEATKTIEARQADYAEKLKELRNKAFEHRKALAQAATAEKSKLIDKARQDAALVRKDAAEKLAAQREAAKSELIAQVDALADSMVQHLLKQA